MSPWARWRELTLGEQLYYWRAYALGRRTLWDDAAPDRPAFLERLRPGVALDAGCGAGRNAIELARRGWQVVGVDLHRVALSRARTRAEAAGVSVRWVQAPASRLDALTLPPFDLVLDVFGPASDLSPSGRERYARGLARALEPGGLLAVFTFEEAPTMAPFLDAFAIDHRLAEIAPRSPAGRWWLFRRRPTPSP